jgi:hypothetical protein
LRGIACCWDPFRTSEAVYDVSAIGSVKRCVEETEKSDFQNLETLSSTS